MPPRTPLDDVEFLASSPNRVEVLETLADEPHTRAELHDVTGISQPTLGRVLGDFQERNWVRREKQAFSLTPLGTLLVEEVGDLLETVETLQRLGDMAPHLPLEDLPFDVREFRDATITVPDPPDVFAHVRRGEELVRQGDEIRWLGNNIYLDAIPKQREMVAESGNEFEVVIRGEALDVALDYPETVAMIRDLVGRGAVTAYRFDGEVPFSLATVDDVAAIVPYDENYTAVALIETRNEVIRRWVTDTIDDYRDRAERVTVDDLPE